MTTDIAATFDEAISAATATPETFVVHGQQSGLRVGSANSVMADGPTVSLDPTRDFFPGEVVQVTATSGIQSSGGDPAMPRVWQFRPASGGTGEFGPAEQSLGTQPTWGVALGDLDGDGDLDAFVANGGNSGNQPNRVWLNNGGIFSDSGQSLGNLPGSGVSLGDIDDDGDLDAVIANGGRWYRSGGQRVWLNDGSGVFADSGQSLGDGGSDYIALGDLDGDGDLDAFVGGHAVWFNDGGVFSNSGQLLEDSSEDVALGDLDDDGDLDAFSVGRLANRMWLNDGRGQFSDSGQQLGNHSSFGVSLGDLDGDGDLDAFVANKNSYPLEGNRVWLNNEGVFSDSGQVLGDHYDSAVALGDLDGDGDLDAFAANSSFQGDRVWLNNGNALFADSGQSVGNEDSYGVSLGDLDGDGDLDAFVANAAFNGANRVWLNQNPPNQVSLHVDSTTIGEGDAATVSATLAAPATQDLTVQLDFSGTATFGDDYTLSKTQVTIPAGAMAGSLTVMTVQDSLDELDETVIVDITGVANGGEAGEQRVIVTIVDDDEPVVPDVTFSAIPGQIPESGGVSIFTASLSESTTIPVVVELAVAISSSATLSADYNLSDSLIAISPGTTSGSVRVTALQDEVDEPNETVTLEIVGVTGGAEAGQQSATTTILDDDVPPTFRLSSFTPTSGGFTAQLSAAVDTSVLNLVDTQTAGHRPADATLLGVTTGPIAGSLVVSPNGQEIEFLATGARLATDTYTVILRSADNGIKDISGNLLDGNGDGTSGDDYSDTFTVASNITEIGVQDFVRGPGQELNLPANSINGIPITISDGATVRRATFAIDYDPDLLDITGVVPGTSMPAGSTATVETTMPGRTVVTFSSPTDVPAGSNQLVNLQANVPTANIHAIYGNQHVLDINAITLTNATGTELPAIDNDGVHLAAFFGDVSGNGDINANDASQVARVAALLDSGFAEFLLTDPMILADVSGNGVINATDASMVARHAVELPVDEIPPIPGGVVISGLAATAPLPDSLVAASVPGALIVDDLSNRTTASSSTTVAFVVPPAVPSPALDSVIADREYSALGTNEDDLRLVPPLEEAVEELLTALLAQTA